MSLRNEAIRIAVLIVLVSALWCRIYHRYTVSDWRIPTEYTGDGLFVLAWTKAAYDGEFLPVASKTNRYLNAPFIANWNDFPLSEDMLFWTAGALAHLIGLGAAINFSFMAACVLAAVTFYGVCRYLRRRWEWCFMGSILFGLSSYVHFRNISHIFYTHYWHLPLCLLVSWWAGSRQGLTFGNRRYYFSVGVAVITGFLTVYYTNFFLQFLGLATLSQLVRRAPWRKVIGPLSIGATALACFLLASLDTIGYAIAHGYNPNALLRNYLQVARFSLTPLELFIPPAVHSWQFMRDLCFYYIGSLAGTHQFSEFVYLGVVGGCGLILLLIGTVIGLIKRPARANVPGLQAIWITAYGMIGGLNCLIALAGFPLFHAMNRVSIVVLLLSLFYLVKCLSRGSGRWPCYARITLAGGIVIFGLMDQNYLLVTKRDIQQTRGQYDGDCFFVESMESKLPAAAMVFQLPVTQFPESGVRNKMSLYELLRPYLFSRNLRFSHGTCKGRESDSWQREMEALSTSTMADRLERYGFSAICINQRAYSDRGAKMIAELRSTGRGEVIFSNGTELACVFLHPVANPILPELLTNFRQGWWPIETGPTGVTGEWSKGNASIVIHNTTNQPLTRYFNCNLSSIKPRSLVIKLGGKALWRKEFKAYSGHKVEDMELPLPPGKTTLEFATDTPAWYAPKDPRKLAFMLVNFELNEKPRAKAPLP